MHAIAERGTFYKKEGVRITANIIGFGSVVQGTSKKSGREYYGQSLELTYSKKGIEGLAVKEQFISFLELDKIPDFKLGQQIFLDYDDSGFLLDFEILDSNQ